MFEVVEFVEHEPGQQATETRLAHANDVDDAISGAQGLAGFREREPVTPMPGGWFGSPAPS